MQVSKHKSISSAARELKVSSSTISRKISALESKLGKKLFLSDGKKIQLTLDGQQLVKMLNDPYAEFDAVLNSIQHNDSCTVRILGNHTEISALLRIALPVLRAKFPNLKFEFCAYSIYMMKEYGGLFSKTFNNFDIILLSVPLEPSALRLEGWEVFSEIHTQTKLYGHRNFADEIGAIKSLKSLKNIPVYHWKYYPEMWTITNDNDASDYYSYEPEIFAVSDMVLTLVEMMPVKFGITQICPTLVENYGLDDSFIPIFPDYHVAHQVFYALKRETKNYLRNDRTLQEITRLAKKIMFDHYEEIYQPTSK